MLRANLQKKTESVEAALNEEKGKRQEAKKFAQDLKKKLSVVETQAQEASSRALVEFWES